MDLLTSTRSSRFLVAPGDAWSRLLAGGPGAHWYDTGPLALRAGLDRLLGGTAPAPVPDRALRAGDAVFFWDVTHAEAHAGTYELSLRARVRAPGTVTLRVGLDPTEPGTRLTQSVRFDPQGVLGTAYLLADLPARELLIELVHRRTRAAIGGA